MFGFGNSKKIAKLQTQFAQLNEQFDDVSGMALKQKAEIAELEKKLATNEASFAKFREKITIAMANNKQFKIEL